MMIIAKWMQGEGGTGDIWRQALSPSLPHLMPLSAAHHTKASTTLLQVAF